MATRLFVTVESLGSQTTDRLYRFCDGPSPSWDSDNVYVECLQRFPGSIAPEIDFRNGSASIGGMSFEMIAASVVRPLLYNQRRTQIDTLQTALSKTDVSIDLTLTTLANTSICLGHEVIRLGSHSGGGTYTCTRGMLGTDAKAHGIGEQDYVSVFDAATGPVLRFRRVTFGLVNTDTASSYSGEETLWAGLLTGINAPSPHLIRVDADGLLTLLSKKTINNKPWQSRRGAAGLGTIRWEGSPEVQAPVALIGDGTPRGSASGTLFAVGSDTLVKSAYTASTAFTTVIIKPQDVVEGAAAFPVDPRAIHEVYGLTGTGSTTALPLSRNLITACLQILTSTNTAGENGNYDTGESDLGLWIPVGRVDVTGAEELRSTLGELVEMDTLYIGWEGKPVNAIEWIQEHLLPFGVVLTDDEGTLRFAILEDNSALTTTVLTVADIVPPPKAPMPKQSRRLDNAFDEVVVDYDFRPGHGVISDAFNDGVAKFLNRYGDSSQLKLNLEGLSARAKIETVAIQAAQTWHQEIPQIDLTVLRTRNDIGIGDLVLLTHPLIYQETDGARSVTNEACIVIGKRLDMDAGTIVLRLLDVGVLYERVGRVAPTARVEAWDLVDTVDIKEDYSDSGFQSADLAAYPRDDSAFVAGDKVALCDRTHAVIEDGLEIASVGTNSLTFVVAPTATPADGNLIKFSSYNQATASQTGSFVFIADANEKVGSGNEHGYEWTR